MSCVDESNNNSGSGDQEAVLVLSSNQHILSEIMMLPEIVSGDISCQTSYPNHIPASQNSDHTLTSQIPHKAEAESDDKTLQNLNTGTGRFIQPNVILAPVLDRTLDNTPNVNQEVVILAPGVGEMVDNAAEKTNNKKLVEISEENLQESSASVNSQVQKSKACAVLLGRGNSFSLGRSEVILLHAARRRRAHTATVTNLNWQNLPDESANIENNNMGVQFWSNRTRSLSDHCAAVSEHKSLGTLAARTHRSSYSVHVQHDLETLWQKAESVMSAKQSAVQQVLEEFGISDTGAWEEDAKRVAEEETVWQAVQDNFNF